MGLILFFDRLQEKNKKDEKYAYDEVCKNIAQLDLDIKTRFSNAVEDVHRFYQIALEHGLKKENLSFFIGLFTKYIYSRLIDADRLDAASFETSKSHGEPKQHQIEWQSLLRVFEEKMGQFDSTSPVNAVRKKICDACADSSDNKTGIYKLAVPTGGGKTLASLNFALRHAMKTGKRRIIYVIPYLSITTQTSQVFRNILNLSPDSDVLLEHYSSAMKDAENDSNINSDGSESENESERTKARKLAAERWDNPIIVTTMVQFLETVMSSHGTKLRKFHNMADSVIIFDEIQALPSQTINLFNETVSFLSTILNCTILLCSATQPLLEKTNRHNLLLADHSSLISINSTDQETLRRTNIVASDKELTSDELARFAFEKAQENGNCLVIVNLKSEAKDVFRALVNLNSSDTFDLVHLSTSMCGQHRKNQLEHVRSTLAKADSKRVICVSTQLVEAGVDLSFSCVVRALAGLDSVLQAAGRCNRNGESFVPKNVYVVPMRGEQGLNHLPDIQIGKEITDQLIREFPDADLLSDSMLDEYYRRLFNRLQPAQGAKFGKMDYPIGQDKEGIFAYDLLSLNELGKDNFENRHGEKKYGNYSAQAYKTVSGHFHLIPNLTQNVIVRYGRANELLEQFEQDRSINRFRTLRALQDYTVSLFTYEYDALSRKHAIELVDDTLGIYVLDSEYYDDRYGVVAEAELSPMFF